jgi:hypothetical protein
MRLDVNQLQIKNTPGKGEGELRMGIALRLSKKQLLLLVIVLLSLIVTAVIVLHAAAPNLLHAIGFSPDIIIHWH